MVQTGCQYNEQILRYIFSFLDMYHPDTLYYPPIYVSVSNSLMLEATHKGKGVAVHTMKAPGRLNV
jgi:hypothetical protein